MATFKICVRRQRKDGVFPVFIRVTHKREARYINTEKLVLKEHLRKGEVKDPEIVSYCSSLIKSYCDKLNAVDISNWDINEIISYLQKADEDISFSEYARKYVHIMASEWKMERNAKNYRWACQSLEKFAGTSNLMFSKTTTKLLQDWISSLANTHRAKEMYPVCIRMIYKAALDE